MSNLTWRTPFRWLSLLCLAMAGVLFVVSLRMPPSATLVTGQIVPLSMVLSVVTTASVGCLVLAAMLYTLTEPQWRWWAVIWAMIVIEFAAMAGVAVWQHTPLGYTCAVVVALTWVGGFRWLLRAKGGWETQPSRK